MGQLRKPKKKKVTEQPADMPDEVWQYELSRRKVITEDRQKRRVVAKEKRDAAIAEAAEAEYLAKHAGSTAASQSGKIGATQGSSTAGSSRPRSPSSPALFSEPLEPRSRSQSRFSSPEIGESEVQHDPNAVFSSSSQDPTPRRGVAVDLNDSYTGSPAMRRGHIFADEAMAPPNCTLFHGDTEVLGKMHDATEVSILFPMSPYLVDVWFMYPARPVHGCL